MKLKRIWIKRDPKEKFMTGFCLSRNSRTVHVQKKKPTASRRTGASLKRQKIVLGIQRTPAFGLRGSTRMI